MIPRFLSGSPLVRTLRSRLVPAAVLFAVLHLSIAVAGEPAAGDIKVSRQVLGKRPVLMDISTRLVSDDGQHLAFVVRRAQGSAVWLDGVEGPAYEKILSPLLFSPVGGRLAYVARKAGASMVVVLDGKEVGTNQGFKPGEFRFSPDGKRFAYAMSHPTNDFVSLPPYSIPAESANITQYPLPPADVKSIVLHGFTPLSVVLDGQAGRGYATLNGPTLFFSPDSKHLAYVAVPVTTKNPVKGPGLVVLDGVETRVYDDVFSGPVFSPDSRRLAFVVLEQGKKHVVVCNCPLEGSGDGQVGRAYDTIAEGLNFSPDSKHVVYRAEREGKRFLVVDEQEIIPPGAKEFNDPIFSPDSQRMAIQISRGDKSLWLVDNEPGPEFDGVGTLRFSPDSHRTAYLARSGGSWYMVLDGKQSRAFEAIGEPYCFTCDSRTLLAIVTLDKKYRVLRNLEVHLAEYDWVGQSILLSPDGRHDAFFASRKDRGTFLVLDGREGPVVSQGPIVCGAAFGGAAFAGNRTIYAVAIDADPVTFEDEFVRLELPIPDGPNTATQDSAPAK